MRYSWFLSQGQLDAPPQGPGSGPEPANGQCPEVLDRLSPGAVKFASPQARLPVALRVGGGEVDAQQG